MSYGKRRYYNKRRGRSSNRFGGMVNDTAAIANKFGPKGAFITGVLGFLSFYFVFPWILVAWSDHNKAKMTGQLAPMLGKLLDDVFLRRFIHPLEWAGIAVLIVCVGISCWKAFTRTDLGYQMERDATWLAKTIAKFVD